MERKWSGKWALYFYLKIEVQIKISTASKASVARWNINLALLIIIPTLQNYFQNTVLLDPNLIFETVSHNQERI